MKLLFSFLFAVCFFSLQSQSLIDDIMNVEAVSIENSVVNEEATAEFTSALEEEKIKAETAMEKHSDKYKEKVTKLIEDFTNVLAKGNEKEVILEKRSLASRVNSFTIALRRTKKQEVNRFKNEMTPLTRELPKYLIKQKEDEIAAQAKEFLAAIEKEYNANQAAIKSFSKKEHLKIEK